MTFGNFILGMIIAVIGYLTVWKSEWLFVNFGSIGFAEKYLQTSGGSRLFYKIIGFLLIIIGLLVATDLLDNFFQWTLGGLFGRTIIK
jgi:hypothetical protein